jgi:hypothetical protein
MSDTDLHKFAVRLQQVLSKPWDFTGPKNYICLHHINEVTREMLNGDTGCPEGDPLTDAFNLIIEQAQHLYAENIVLGINEILKTYLKRVNEENQKAITLRVMECLKLLFQFITGDNFPYTEKIWEAISLMTKPVGLFLIRERLFAACAVFFESAAFLGRQAARKGLSTGILQHAFRISELASRKASHPELASLLQNLRQNLES